MVRTGRITVYGGYAWRGRSKGAGPTTVRSRRSLERSARSSVDRAGPIHRRGPLVLGTVPGIRLRCETRATSSDPTLLVIDRNVAEGWVPKPIAFA